MTRFAPYLSRAPAQLAGFVYLDLKDQNVLLDSEGKARLADFGLAADVSKGPITSNAGTRGFIAPEQYEKVPFTTSPDIWALGICAFHWAVGKGPFASQTKDKKKTEELVLAVSYDTAEKKLESKGLKPLVVDALVVKDVQQRLGCGVGGIGDLKKHEFFAPLDWMKLEAGTLPAPITPGDGCLNAPMASDINTEVFDKYKGQAPSQAAEAQFKNWAVVNKVSVEEAAIKVLEEGLSYKNDKRQERRRSSADLKAIADVTKNKTISDIEKAGPGSVGNTAVKQGGGGCCVIA